MSAQRKTDVQIGNQYGCLLVKELRLKPRNNGYAEAQAYCVCACGKESWYTETRLRRGHALKCNSCSAKSRKKTGPRIPFHEQWLCRKERGYRKAAQNKNRDYPLTREQFRSIFQGTCVYCGEFPAFGIDRRDNLLGYTLENSVSCCSICNYAKRDMTVEEFIGWVKRVHIFRGWKK